MSPDLIPCAERVSWVALRDEELMVSLSTGSVFVWNLQSGASRHVPLFRGLEVRAYFFPDDDGVLLLGGRPFDRVARLDRQGGFRWIAVAACQDVVPVARRSAVTNRGERIDFATGLTVVRAELIDGLAVSLDGNWVATAAAVFDASSGVRRSELALNDHQPNRMVFSPDARLLASAGAEGRLVLFEVESGPAKVVLENMPATALAFSPDSRLIAVGDGPRIGLWNRDGAHLGKLGALERPSHAVTREVWFVDQRLLVALFSDGRLTIFDVARRETLATLAFFDRGRWMAVAPDGSWEGTPELGGVPFTFSGDGNQLLDPVRLDPTAYRPGWLSEAILGYSETEPTRSISASGRSS